MNNNGENDSSLFKSEERCTCIFSLLCHIDAVKIIPTTNFVLQYNLIIDTTTLGLYMN